MISGNLTPIPQNSIAKATVCHKKFSHISHNFVNKMRLVPIFHKWPTDPVFLVCLSTLFTTLCFLKIWTPIPENRTGKATVWHKKFSHISHNFVNKMRLVPIFRIQAHRVSLLSLLILIIYL